MNPFRLREQNVAIVLYGLKVTVYQGIDVTRLSSDVTVRTSSIAFYLSMFFILKNENVRPVEK